MFIEAIAHCVVAVVDAQRVVFKSGQTVEYVPVQLLTLAIVPAFEQVAVFVVVMQYIDLRYIEVYFSNGRVENKSVATICYLGQSWISITTFSLVGGYNRASI